VVLGLYEAWSQRQWMEAAADNADAQAMAQLFREDAVASTSQATDTPDIIFVTSESFFDVTRLEGLTFETDPLPNYHALAETCTDGKFLSNTFGGGTGYVEMEMFTGLTSSLLKEGDTLSTLDTEVYETLPTTVRLLKQAGYTTAALHSYNDTLYNRSTVYPLIGFDETIFVEDFLVPVTLTGPYPSDDSFANEIIARYEARDTTKPCFLYGMSMENHQAYTTSKYGELSDYPAQSDLLSQADLEILDSLVYGLHDADAALGKLVDYFSNVDRPVMLVFVGDHLPSVNLADGTSLYTRLGYNNGEASSTWSAETLAEILSTNYLIWTNYEAEAEADHTESCTFLGLHALQRAGLPLNDYFTWLAEDVSSQFLLSRGTFLAQSDGTPTYDPTEEEAAALEHYEQVEWNLAYP
jgi:phosphoglycerol transferase MdoB-like AlkP superfamily enzyme